MKNNFIRLTFVSLLTISSLFTLNLYATTYRVKESTTMSGNSEIEVREVTRASGSSDSDIVNSLMKNN